LSQLRIKRLFDNQIQDLKTAATDFVAFGNRVVVSVTEGLADVPGSTFLAGLSRD
jgi:hypothetical protein